MTDSEQNFTLTRRQIQAAVAVSATAAVAYVGAWMWLDSNFDYNREEMIREAETTREQIVNQGIWTRSELLAVLQACAAGKGK